MYKNTEQNKLQFSDKEENNIKLLIKFLESNKYIIFTSEYLCDKIFNISNNLDLPIMKLYYDQYSQMYLHYTENVATIEDDMIFVSKINSITRDENKMISSLIYDENIFFKSKLDNFDRYINLLSFL